jgi:hypothetical protein
MRSQRVEQRVHVWASVKKYARREFEIVSTVSTDATPDCAQALGTLLDLRTLQSTAFWALSVLTVVTVAAVASGQDFLILMMRVPPRPSRPKVISMPNARSGVCARRSRPASARGDFGHPTPVQDASSLGLGAATRKRSVALPLHMTRAAMMSRMRAATGSASTISSIADRRFAL